MNARRESSLRPVHTPPVFQKWGGYVETAGTAGTAGTAHAWGEPAKLSPLAPILRRQQRRQREQREQQDLLAGTMREQTLRLRIPPTTCGGNNAGTDIETENTVSHSAVPAVPEEYMTPPWHLQKRR